MPFQAGKFRKIQIDDDGGVLFAVFSDHPLNANEKQAATRITIMKKKVIY